MRTLFLPGLPLLAALIACQPGGGESAVPGDSTDQRPFGAVAPRETVRFSGTEPFWSGEASDSRLVYRTPEQPDGRTIDITRFAGRGGLAISGRLDGAAFDMTVSDGACSDGMSDRRYPFTATLRIGDAVRNGCAWTDARPPR